MLGVSFLETGLSGAALCENGAEKAVSYENLEEFLNLATSFWFDHGVQAQARLA